MPVHAAAPHTDQDTMASAYEQISGPDLSQGHLPFTGMALAILGDISDVEYQNYYIQQGLD